MAAFEAFEFEFVFVFEFVLVFEFGRMNITNIKLVKLKRYV